MSTSNPSNFSNTSQVSNPFSMFSMKSIKLNFLQALDEVSRAKEDRRTDDIRQITTDAATHQKEVSMRDKPDMPVIADREVQGIVPQAVREQKTIITRDSQIDGSIKTRGSLDIDGVVNGNVSCEQSLTIRGKVTGDISAENIDLQSSDIKGNVTVKSAAVMQTNSAVAGNILAKTAEINGTVNGDIKAAESLVIRSEANITGDIITASLEVARGAVINGKITIEKTNMTKPVREAQAEPVKTQEVI